MNAFALPHPRLGHASVLASPAHAADLASSSSPSRVFNSPRRFAPRRMIPHRMSLFDALRTAVSGGAAKPSAATFAGSADTASSRPQTLSEDPALAPYVARVARINALEDSIESLDNDALRGRLRAIRKDVAATADTGTALEAALEEVFAIVREASFRVLGIRHYDVQLVGGMVLHDGQVAEMATGEGKTYVAALPAVLNALSGSSVHVVTVNDYLAKRDAELIGQIYRFLGLSVGLVQSSDTREMRRQAYSRDITYVTNSELGFDYLRDNLAMAEEEVSILQPFGLCIVDEADSILIDEARTPLIISGRVPAPQHKYYAAEKAARQLEKDMHYTVSEKEQNVVLTEQGFSVLEAALGVNDLFDVANPWASYITNALKAKELFQRDVNYIVRDAEKDIQIVDEFTGRIMEGRRWSDGLHQAIEAKEGLTVDEEATTIASVSYQAFFKLFPKLSGMTGTAATEASELFDIYGLPVRAIPTALPCARKDYDDVVFRSASGKYRAVMSEIARVAPTGRPMLIGTTSIEASETLSKLLTEVEVPHEILNARPESALRESEIIAQAGRMYSITIATNMAGRGTDILLGGNAGYFARALARKQLVSLNSNLYAAMVADDSNVVLIDDADLPCSISEEAFKLLSDAADRVAARNSISTLQEIDELVGVAAEYGPISDDLIGVVELRTALDALKAEMSDVIASEREAIIKAGGLMVIGTERAESRRVDNQLRGRAGRQGDPGGSRFFLALDDSLFRVFGGEKVTSILDAFRVEENTPIENKIVTTALNTAQENVESYYADIRKQLFTYDDVLSTQRAALYAQRRKIMFNANDELLGRLEEDCLRTGAAIREGYEDTKDDPDGNFGDMSKKLAQFFPDIPECTPADLSALNKGSLAQHVDLQVRNALAAKTGALANRRVDLPADVARILYLTQVDNLWQAHMKSMDYLKEFVVLRAYSNDDPLQAYQKESFDLFTLMLQNIARNTVYSYFQYQRTGN